MAELEARSRGGGVWGAVIVLGHRAGGGVQGVSPLHKGVWGISPINEKGGLWGVLPPKTVLLKSKINYTDFTIL